MKFHMLLQAISSMQAQRGNLRIYVKIELLERGKLCNAKCGDDEENKHFMHSESDGMTYETLVMRVEE